MPWTPMNCSRCGHVLVDEDEQGWYYQQPVTDPEAPGLTFMDRIHKCGDGAAHIAAINRPRLIQHLHEEHGGYPAGHDFVLVSTTDIQREHLSKHEPIRVLGSNENGD